jgi:hypothetical protein
MLYVRVSVAGHVADEAGLSAFPLKISLLCEYSRAPASSNAGAFSFAPHALFIWALLLARLITRPPAQQVKRKRTEHKPEY